MRFFTHGTLDQQGETWTTAASGIAFDSVGIGVYDVTAAYSPTNGSDTGETPQSTPITVTVTV